MFMRTFTCSECSARGSVYAVCRAEPATWPSSLRQIGRDFLASFDQRCDGLCRLFEHGAFGAVQLNLDDALDALRADHGGHADIKVLDPVLAVKVGRARKHALLVLEKALRHGDGRR